MSSIDGMTAEVATAPPTSDNSATLPFSLKPPTVAELLNLPLSQVYALLPRGDIPGARKIRGQWRINRDVLLTWLKGNPVPRR